MSTDTSHNHSQTDEERITAQATGSTRLHYVASYPKSGNTWIRLVAAAYAMGKEAGLQDLVQYDDISVFAYQAVSPIPLNDLGGDVEAQLRPAAMMVLAWQIEDAVLVKSHHACVAVNGMHLWNPQWCGKVVNPVRDPRDICCSAKDHFGMDSYMDAAEFMSNDGQTIGGDDKLHHVLGTWSDHVKSWLETDQVPVHTVRYEDMQDDPAREFADILDFLGVGEVNGERVEWAVEVCRFDRLQEMEEKAGFPEKSEHQDRFFRKGKAGGWQDELPSEVARKIEDDHSEMMERLGYL